MQTIVAIIGIISLVLLLYLMNVLFRGDKQ